ncbi:hypothetical protein BC826DRAFT_1021667 [Russula brevipes]|nr:hypothetical protein BC826DRAFT_1021667 [Russula brevipes]
MTRTYARARPQPQRTAHDLLLSSSSSLTLLFDDDDDDYSQYLRHLYQHELEMAQRFHRATRTRITLVFGLVMLTLHLFDASTSCQWRTSDILSAGDRMIDDTDNLPNQPTWILGDRACICALFGLEGLYLLALCRGLIP